MPEFEPAAPNPQISKERSSKDYSPPPEFIVQFWGVRGRVAAPGKDTMRYGGNTSCVEMRVGGKRLIFDGGTGLRVLGNNLLRQMPLEAHMFFTHSHWEGIQGFPFFVPAFIKGNCFHIYGAGEYEDISIKQSLSDQMLPPNFPVPIQVMQSELKFYHLTSGDVVTLGEDITIEICLINNPHQTTGYRVVSHGLAAVYATGTKYGLNAQDPNLLHLVRQADLLICDATSTQLGELAYESSNHNGQDAPWQSCIEVAKTAGVKQLVMSRHDPDYSDDVLDCMESQIQADFPNSLLAREGMVLSVSEPET